jgi:hypothetical protein
MILLEFGNKIVAETLRDRLNACVQRAPFRPKWAQEGGKGKRGANRALMRQMCREGKPESVNVTVADFDGVLFHVSTRPEDKKRIVVSVSTRCFNELKQCNVHDVLARVYGVRGLLCSVMSRAHIWVRPGLCGGARRGL